jgi:predicted kinase
VGGVRGRLVLLCGLPGAGKTTLGRRLAVELPAVRLCPDEWLLGLGLDPFDGSARERVERLLWAHAQELLALGHAVIMENGFWDRPERDELRQRARDLGAAVELRYLDVPLAELHRRVARRNQQAGAVVLAPELLDACVEQLDVPTRAELALFDPPAHHRPRP